MTPLPRTQRHKSQVTSMKYSHTHSPGLCEPRRTLYPLFVACLTEYSRRTQSGTTRVEFTSTRLMYSLLLVCSLAFISPLCVARLALPLSQSPVYDLLLCWRECCLLVLSLVSSTLPCIRQPRPRLRVLDICGFVLVCTQAFIGF
jgi:hypothetical protein